jgi:diguanylate cyclase (GGDEF)-like protein
LDPSIINYMIVNIGCLIYALIIAMMTSLEIGNEAEVRTFRSIQLSFAGYLVTDTIWMLGTHIDAIDIHVTIFMNAAGMIFIAFMTYFWFQYCELRLKQKYQDRLWFSILTVLPVVAEIILHLISFSNGCVFYVKDGVFYHGPLYLVANGFSAGYGVLVLIHVIWVLTHVTSKEERHECRTMIFYVCIPIGAYMVDEFIPNTAIVAIACFTAYLLIFINLQRAEIYNDALTGLYNRRQADHLLNEAIGRAGEYNAFYLIMLDIDSFKEINDTYGHLYGDEVLKAVADALNRIADIRGRSFAARWGGDEFMMMIPANGIGSISEFLDRLDDEMPEMTPEDDVTMKVTVSAGWALCNTPRVQEKDLIAGADALLYSAKLRKKRRQMTMIN